MDVTTAKGYLDKYVANADKDCKTHFFVWNYLFRAGKYQESLQQAKSMEAGGCASYSRINVLYAYNYDRLGDSLQARSYIQKYFSTANPDEIQATDYAFSGTVLAKFPESTDSAIIYLKKAILLDTIKEEQANFLKTASTVAAASGNYRMMLDLLRTAESLNGGKLSAAEYFTLGKSVADAPAKDSSATFDSVKYTLGDSIILAYVNAYPDKPQGYQLETRYAKTSDKDTSRGLAIAPIERYNEFLAKDTAAGNKKTIFTNYYFLLIYYAQYAHDLPKEQEYQKAIDITNKMKTIYTDPSSEEYQFADKTGKQLQTSLDKYNKSKTSGGTNSGGKSQK
jgi:hypothetical protein